MVMENLERMISSHQRQKELPQQPPIIQVRQPVTQSVSQHSIRMHLRAPSRATGSPGDFS